MYSKYCLYKQFTLKFLLQSYVTLFVFHTELGKVAPSWDVVATAAGLKGTVLIKKVL
jgi:hypothetical protein